MYTRNTNLLKSQHDLKKKALKHKIYSTQSSLRQQNSSSCPFKRIVKNGVLVLNELP